MVQFYSTDKLRDAATKPNWRYDVLLNPNKYNLSKLLSRSENGSNGLRRYIRNGLPYSVDPPHSEELKELLKDLPEAEANKAKELITRYQKINSRKPVSVDYTQEVIRTHPLWNLSKVKHISDQFLVRAIKHVANYEHDEYIAKAILMFRSEEYQEIINFIGYCLYAKISVVELAKRWSIPVRVIDAIRLLFFDFSKFPKDRIANFTHLRQLANNGVIDDVQFGYYKRVYELGELGLKAQVDFYNLTDSEKKTISEYLGNSIVANTLNLNFSVRNQKDALSYGATVTGLTSYYIRNAEMAYFHAKTRNLDAVTRRIEGGLLTREEGLTAIDKELLDLLKQNSLLDAQVEYKTFAQLK